MLSLLFVAFFLLLAIHLPVAFALGLAALAAIASSGTLPVSTLVTQMFSALDSYTLLAIPFFIAAGEIMNASGITDRLVVLSRALVGHVRGGLAHVTIVCNMFFSGISGSATADASALGSIMIPAMSRSGFARDFAVAVSASASAMGPIIPPSILMVIYGSIANVSIAQLFLGGVIPGVTVGLGLMLVAYLVARRRGYEAEERADWATAFRALRGSVLAIVMPLIILGGIFSGAFTPTEAGVMAVVYASLVGLFVYKSLTLFQLSLILVRSAITTATALFVLAAAGSFAWLLAWEGFGDMALELLLTLTSDPSAVVFLILGLVLVLGLVVEGIPVLVIMTPVLLPVISSIGTDPVHFGIVLVMAIVIGSVTPPVGILTYLSCAIAGIPVSRVFWSLWPFCAIMIGVLALCAWFGEVVMVFNRLLY